MAILFLLFLVSGPRGLFIWVGANSVGDSHAHNDQTTPFPATHNNTTNEDTPCHSGMMSTVLGEGGHNGSISTVIINCTNSNGSSNNKEVESSGSQSSSSGRSSRRRNPYANGQMSKEDYELAMSIIDPLRFSLHVGVLPVLALAVISFSREKVITDSTAYMIAINVVEFFCSFLNAVLYVMKYGMDNATTNQTYIAWVLLSNYGIVGGRRSVYLLTTVLCIQRFIAVTMPMKSRQMMAQSSRYTVLVSTIAGTFTVHVYITLMYDIKHLGGGVYIMTKSAMYSDNIFVFDCLGYITKTVFSYIPLLASLVVNLILIVFMKRHNQSVKSMRSSKDEAAKSKQDRQMTWMILVSTLSFTILSIPSNINYMIATLDDAYGTRKADHYLYSFVKGITNGLQTLADFINFLCYVTLSSSFRQKVKATLMCRPTDGARKSSTSLKKTDSGQKTGVATVTTRDSGLSSSVE